MSKSYLFLLISLVIVSCQTKEASVDQLFAKWSLTEGFRDGQKTDMLDGLYFDFAPDGKLETNFLGVTEKGSYVMNGKDITLEIATKTKLTIEEMSDDKLVLTSMIQGRPFRFILVKK